MSGKGIGKGVLVRVEGLAAAPLGADAKPPGEKPPSQVIMCILRATDRIQLSKVAKQMRADSATLCTEAEVNVRTPLNSAQPLHTATGCPILLLARSRHRGPG